MSAATHPPTSPSSASAGHEKPLPVTARDLPRKVENRKKSANLTQLLAYHCAGPQVYRCTAVLLLYAAVMDWSVRAAPLLLCCCCTTAVMVGCGRPTRSVLSLSRRRVPAFLSHRVRVVLFVLPSSVRSPPRRLATPFFSVNRSCLETPPSYGYCILQQFFSSPYSCTV